MAIDGNRWQKLQIVGKREGSHWGSTSTSSSCKPLISSSSRMTVPDFEVLLRCETWASCPLTPWSVARDPSFPSRTYFQLVFVELRPCEPAREGVRETDEGRELEDRGVEMGDQSNVEQPLGTAVSAGSWNIPGTSILEFHGEFSSIPKSKCTAKRDVLEDQSPSADNLPAWIKPAWPQIQLVAKFMPDQLRHSFDHEKIKEIEKIKQFMHPPFRSPVLYEL
ncbi:hypothetical protein BD309DRAFT_985230, partial [Dichomitus squalens]